jgi:peptidoglycan/xylan/chitin deacetylase (PgdA/CDA1 family)
MWWKTRSGVAALRLTLDALRLTRLDRLLARRWGGVGAILMLHRVLPARPAGVFAPNQAIEITPEFLDLTIRHLRERGWDIVDLDEMRRRLTERDLSRRFACFTLDDGLRDQLVHAAPVFLEHGVPFTVYVCTSVPDGTADLWRQVLEEIVRQSDEVIFDLDGSERCLRARTVGEKLRAFWTMRTPLHRADPERRRDCMERMSQRHGIDTAAVHRECLPTWEMLRDLAQGGLATIGAHTVSHPICSRLSIESLQREMSESREIIARRVGQRPCHFAYPFGDRASAGRREFRAAEELGFETAVTTRKGMLFSDHARHLHALPRLSLHGHFQSARHLSVLLSGAPTALWNRFRRVDA